MVKFLLLALFYGDHPELAMRCCTSLRGLWNTGEVDVRMGLAIHADASLRESRAPRLGVTGPAHADTGRNWRNTA